MADAWGYAIAVVVGVIISEGIRWLRDWREGREKYRIMLYEKCLEVHQKAFYHVQQLLHQFGPCVTGYGYPNDEELTLSYRDAKSFYDSKCLYLDKRSRDEMMRGISKTRFYLEAPDEYYITEAFDQLLKAREAIMTGIGMKHIEEPKKELPPDKP